MCIQVGGGWINANVANVLLDIMNLIYTFHMPLFMMISGYVYARAYFVGDDNAARKERIYRQAANLLAVYALFSLGYGICKLILNKYSSSPLGWKGILLFWAKPLYGTYGWYLYVQAAFYLLFLSISNNKYKRRNILITLMAISLVASFTNIDWFKISNIMYFALFFYIGLQYYRDSKFAMGNRILCSVLFCFAMILIMLFWDRSTHIDVEHMTRIEQVPVVKLFVSLGISFALWRLFENIDLFGQNKFLIYLGKHTLEIYLIHDVLLSVIRKITDYAGISNVVVGILLNLTLSISLPILFSQFCKKTRIYGFIFKPVTQLKERGRQC